MESESKMSDILELAKLTTEIIIKPTYKIGPENKDSLARVDCRVCFKAPDGCIQYVQIHIESTSTELAISRALKYAKAYSEAENKNE